MSERSDEAAKVVLAKCMAYDPYFANPAKSTILAWSEHFELRNIATEDLLAGVARFYEFNTEGTKPLPASISFMAREVIRQRSQSETTEQREEREARIDAKVEGRAQDLDAPALPRRNPAEKITVEEWERRHGEKFPSFGGVGQSVDANPLRVRCMWCRQPIGSRCVVSGTAIPLSDFHDCRKAQVEGRCASGVGFHVQPHSEDCQG